MPEGGIRTKVNCLTPRTREDRGACICEQVGRTSDPRKRQTHSISKVRASWLKLGFESRERQLKTQTATPFHISRVVLSRMQPSP